jgi:hypothetical protein
MIKIDYDSRNFKKWLDNFKVKYAMLRRYNVLTLYITSTVWRTRKGYHIYLHHEELMGLGKLTGVNVNVLECLFLSDLQKQLYSYCEANDILFIEKRGFKERFDNRHTEELNEAIRRINRSKRRIIKIVVNGEDVKL